MKNRPTRGDRAAYPSLPGIRLLLSAMLVLGLPAFVNAQPTDQDASVDSSAPSEDEKLSTFFQQYLDQYFLQQPSRATQLGDHRFDHLLEDLSLDSIDQWNDLAKNILKKLPKEVDFAKLSRPSQVDFEIFKHRLTRQLWLAKHTRPFREDPRVYNNYISRSIYLLLTQSTLPRETNVTHAIARMKQIPEVIAAAKANLSNPPTILLETSLRQNQGSISFYKKNIFTLVGQSSQVENLKAIAQQVVAALEDYQTFLENLRSQSKGNWRLGKRKFYQKLDLLLDAGISADQVLSDAEKEFKRVEHEMYVVARQLWSHYFSKQPLPPSG